MQVDFTQLINSIHGLTVERPNKSSSGTLSGHAAGEPFEKAVYHLLKATYPKLIFKQFEFLNDIYRRNPKHITCEQRKELFDSPTAFFLFSRGDKATELWSPDNVFEEKQNDTADIVFHENGFFNSIDVKTRNMSKSAQPPNIISAFKLANMCKIMFDNQDFDTIGIDYIEVDWIEDGEVLRATNAHHADLFKAHPDTLYINWAAAMQVQFHVCNLDQSWTGNREEWAHQYLKTFVKSAEAQCLKIRKKYILPFLKYIAD